MGRRSARGEERRFVLEGPVALAEALAAKVDVEEVFVEPGETDLEAVGAARRAGAEVHVVERGVIARAASTESPQPVLAITAFVDVELDVLREATFLVVCHELRDPGNVGTLLRSARAAGAEGVICTAGSVDLYNPKTVRASAGSLFHVPVVAGGSPVEVLERVGDFGLRRLGATAIGGSDPGDVDLRARVAIVLGNEARGLPDLGPLLDGRLSIPMAGDTESLNVAMAGTLLCFAVADQRRGHAGD